MTTPGMGWCRCHVDACIAHVLARARAGARAGTRAGAGTHTIVQFAVCGSYTAAGEATAPGARSRSRACRALCRVCFH